jgi:hypothetical protein
MDNPLPLPQYETDCSAFCHYQHLIRTTVKTVKVLLISDTPSMVYGILVAWKNSFHSTEFEMAKTSPPQRRKGVRSHSSVNKLLLFTFNIVRR